MKKNALSGHMNPPKKGFGAFLKRLGIIPFLLCAIMAVLLWLVAVNLNTTTASDAETTTELARSAAETLLHAI